MQHFIRKVRPGEKNLPVFTWELLLPLCMWMSYLFAGILASLRFCAGLFTSCLLPRLAEISSFIFSWPCAHECWAKGMSAGCPPGVQTCTEASGDYSPACQVSWSPGGFWVQVKSWGRERKESPKDDDHHSTVMWLKQPSRLFLSLFDLPFLSCLLVWWATLSVPQNRI